MDDYKMNSNAKDNKKKDKEKKRSKLLWPLLLTQS